MPKRHHIIGDLIHIDGNLVLIPNNISSNKIFIKNTEIANLDSSGIQFNGIVTCSQLICLSDMREKKNIKKIEDVLSKLSQLKCYSYELDNQQKIGLLSQEVQSAFPESVNIKNDKLYVDYNSITALLVGAVHELQQQLKEIKK